MKPIKLKERTTLWKRNGGKDIVLNVSSKDALIRFGVVILLPIIVLLINVHMVIYTAPVIAYLFITAIVRFCLIKYCWHHYLLHEVSPSPKAYGKDINYPEESV